MIRRVGVGPLVVALLLGCESGTAFGPEDDRFVETMVALRRAALDAGRDTAAFNVAKTSLLEARGLSEDSLRSFVARRSLNLREMAAIWDSVNARLGAEAAR